MARNTRSQQIKVDPTRPFYAAVGGVDVAVAYTRTVSNRLSQVEIEPMAIPSKVEAKLSEYVEDLNQQYVDLAARGRNLVGRIRRQQATQDLKAETRKTTSKAKTTATQTRRSADSAKQTATEVKKSATEAKKTAGTAKSSAKATGTSAKKTVGAAKKAVQDAGSKTGTTGTKVS